MPNSALITWSSVLVLCWLPPWACTSEGSSADQRGGSCLTSLAGELRGSPGASSGETMRVRGRGLYSAAGQEVVLRGVNEMMIWSPDVTGSSILPEIEKTGANSVRLMWRTSGTPQQLDALVSRAIGLGMIPMVELHDATGNLAAVPKVVDYWVRPDVVTLVQKHERWFLLNIANEAGDNNVSADAFVSAYRTAISRIRATGVKVPLVIDAPGWGQAEDIIGQTWTSLMEHDPERNVIFSVHTYWTGDSRARLESWVSRVVSEDIPAVFGEGPQPNGWDCRTAFPYERALELCQANRIGWLAWSWGAVNNKDCGSPNSPYDITTDGRYGSWASDYARAIVTGPAGIEATSIRPF